MALLPPGAFTDERSGGFLLKITEHTSIPIKSTLVIAVFCIWLAKIEARDEQYKQMFLHLENRVNSVETKHLKKLSVIEAKHDADIAKIHDTTWKRVERILNRLDDIASRLARIEGSISQKQSP